MTTQVLEQLVKDFECSDTDATAEEEDEEDVEKVGEDRAGKSTGTAATPSPKPKNTVTIDDWERLTKAADKELRKSKKKKRKDVTNEIEQNIFASKYKKSTVAHTTEEHSMACIVAFWWRMQSQSSKTSKPTYFRSTTRKWADDAEIIKNCDTMKHLLVELDIACSTLRMPFGTPKKNILQSLNE
jgi:hypothetical protein